MGKKREGEETTPRKERIDSEEKGGGLGMRRIIKASNMTS
jgi:hypothetical protein